MIMLEDDICFGIKTLHHPGSEQSLRGLSRFGHCLYRFPEVAP